MRNLIDIAMRRQRVTVSENRRAIVLLKGRFHSILGPGEHFLPRRDVDVEAHSILRPELVSDLTQALLLQRPDLAKEHLTEVRTARGDLAVVFRDGRPYEVVGPDGLAVYWTDAGPWIVERVDVTGALKVEAKLGARLAAAKLTTQIVGFEVPEGSVGLMAVDGAFDRILGSGTHRFWHVGCKLTAKLIDTRRMSYDVVGQEILTADRVTLRVNLAADYRVTDPEKAVTSVRDFEVALHRSLQFAFRKTLGAKTLDALLGEKISVDAEAAAKVRTEMAAIGLEVGEIALKDVILPGDMRDILNKVVVATKEAEANVIRRREETSATRSLLNTAKVMAENPVMLRLKELEALESIAGKVERLTVHNGTAGLMDDVVRLRD